MDFYITPHYGNVHSKLHRIVFRSALDRTIPVLAVCGGTDLHKDCHNPEYLRQMTFTVTRSRAIVCFNPSMLTKFQTLWPNYTGQVEIIAQSVQVDEVRARDQMHENLSWLENLVGRKLNRFFLIAGRLRPVKDPQFALEPFLEWNQQSFRDVNLGPNHHHLVYVGSVEEDDPSIQNFLSMLTDPHVHQVHSVSRECLHSLMVASDGLINCSLSEGQSLTIMEAMLLRTPVLARVNPGNCDLIKHNETGLLFQSPQELKNCLTKLTCDRTLRNRLVDSALKWMGQSIFQSHYQAKQFNQLLTKVLERNTIQ